MIHLKTEGEIRIMQEAGLKLKKVVAELLPFIKPGITTKKIDEKAEELIKKYGGQPSFKKVKNYFWATCLPINEQAVHTPPSERTIEESDLLTVDVGLFDRGFHTDFATSFIVGTKGEQRKDYFLKVGEKTLEKALAKVKKGNYLGEVSQTIENEIKKAGFFILKELTGHGIGKQLHEDPYVPGFLSGSLTNTYKMRPGLVIAVEVIYSKGTQDIVFEKGSEWSIKTKDGSLAACFEHTVAISNDGTLILT